MNIIRFFNLSISEVEEYLELHQVYDLFYKPVLRQGETGKKMGLTGILSYKFGHIGKIRVQKKSNLYGVYDVDLHKLRDRFEISFSLYYSGDVYLMWLTIPRLAKKIDYVKMIDSVKYLDKTKTLAEIIKDRFRKG